MGTDKFMRIFGALIKFTGRMGKSKGLCSCLGLIVRRLGLYVGGSQDLFTQIANAIARHARLVIVGE